MPPDSPSALFCSGKCTEKADEVIAQAQKMVASMPVGPDGPITGGFTVGQLADLLRMDTQLSSSYLDTAEAGARLTKILDARMVESAKGGPAFRYPTPMEARGDEAWATYQLFRATR
jgi:hypothetical protein